MSLYNYTYRWIRQSTMAAVCMLLLLSSCDGRSDSGEEQQGQDFPALSEAVQSPSTQETRLVRPPMIPLQPAGEESLEGILVFSYQIDNKDRNEYLRYFDTHSAEFLWELKLPAVDNTLQTNIASYDEQRIYLIHANRLISLERKNGHANWQTALSSNVSYDCQDCIQLIDDRIIVLSNDLNLQAFNQDGQLLWTHPLSHTYKNDASIHRVADEIAILDLSVENDISSPIALKFINLQDGSVYKQITPVCSDPGKFYPDTYTDVISPLEIDAAQHTAYFVFSGIRWSCLQAWDTSAADNLWHVETLEKINLPLFEPARTTLLVGNRLYIGTENTSTNKSAAVLSIDTSDGAVTRLIKDADASLFTPLLGDEDQLIARVDYEYTRRPSKLAAYQLDNGELLWEFPLKVKPSSLGDKSADIFQSDDGLAVVQIMDNPSAIFYDLLDLRSGAVSRSVHKELQNGHNEDSHPILIGETVYFMQSNGMYALSLNNESVRLLLGEN